jgi:hypothetical protein
MKDRSTKKAVFKAGLLGLALALLTAAVSFGQVLNLYYQEVEKDGHVYVFNTPERFHSWEQSNDMGSGAVTLVGRGANGETIVAENDTAIDLYLFKHNLPAYDRPTKGKAASGDYPNTKLGIRVYADASSKTNKDDATGLKSSDSGEGVDVKRTYFSITQQFDSVWSANFTSDIGDFGAKRYDVFVKKAYIEAKANPEAVFRLGSADTPWIPYVDGITGLRYIENSIVDELSFGASADWGFHLLGNGPLVQYQLSAVNGRGYSNPTRSKSVDYEGRLSLTPVDGLNFAIGGYSGKRGLETDTLPAQHTATREDALVAYNSSLFRIGGEYFEADNWNTVTSVATDKSDGYSFWGQFNFNPTWGLVGRYDSAKPSKDLKPDLKYTYYYAGLQWTVNKAFTAALVYKYADVTGGTVSTPNGTIGSVNPHDKGKYNEIGVFTVYNF